MFRYKAVNLTAIAMVLSAILLLPLHLPGLPPLRLWIVRAYTVLFCAGWMWILCRPTPPRGMGRVAWPLSSRFVMWGGIVLQMGGFWPWMPYARGEVALACTITVVCTVTLYVMTSIEPPPSSGRIPLAPIVEPPLSPPWAPQTARRRWSAHSSLA